MVNPLVDELVQTCPSLFNHLGLRTLAEHHNPASFGNAIVTLESAEVRVRFIKDRSLISVELSSLTEPDRWWPMDMLCQLVGVAALDSNRDVGECSTSSARPRPAAARPQRLTRLSIAALGQTQHARLLGKRHGERDHFASLLHREVA